MFDNKNNVFDNRCNDEFDFEGMGVDKDYEEYVEWFWDIYGDDVYDEYSQWQREAYGRDVRYNDYGIF